MEVHVLLAVSRFRYCLQSFQGLEQESPNLFTKKHTEGRFLEVMLRPSLTSKT